MERTLPHATVHGHVMRKVVQAVDNVSAVAGARSAGVFGTSYCTRSMKRMVTTPIMMGIAANTSAWAQRVFKPLATGDASRYWLMAQEFQTPMSIASVPARTRPNPRLRENARRSG